MIKEIIMKLTNRENISSEEAGQVMDEIMEGKATDVQISAFLVAMNMKKATIEEITAYAAGMRRHCIRLLHSKDVLEIVGTGGDKSNSFNISTLSALVVSAAGVPVAKHGNRAASSRCGAADLLEALGVTITISPEQSLAILEEIKFCFLFAQNYHISMKYVAPIRKELSIPTIFNILGPLVNPAGANMELLGVYEEALVEPLAQVLCNLGVKNGMVVYGQDKMDEISLSAPTDICEIKNGELRRYVFSPEDYGFTFCKKADLEGGDIKENAKIALNILNGEKGPKRDAVVINSAAALKIAKPDLSFPAAIEKIEATIDSGKALKQLENLIQLSKRRED